MFDNSDLVSDPTVLRKVLQEVVTMAATAAAITFTTTLPKPPSCKLLKIIDKQFEYYVVYVDT